MNTILKFINRHPTATVIGAVVLSLTLSILEAFVFGGLIAIACNILGWLDLSWQTAIGFAILCLVAKIILHPDSSHIELKR